MSVCLHVLSLHFISKGLFVIQVSSLECHTFGYRRLFGIHCDCAQKHLCKCDCINNCNQNKRSTTSNTKMKTLEKTTITTIRNGNGYGQGGVIKQSHELYGLICQTLTLYVLSTQQHHQQPREISFDAVLRDVTHWTLVFLAERETFESSARTHCMAWMNE